MNILAINAKFVSNVLEKFLVEEVNKAGFKKVVIGLSGGIDSSLVAYLCARAFNKKDVYALIMPYRTSNPKNMTHAELITRKLKIKYEIKNISPMVDEFFKNSPDADQNRRGNRMARERMCILYDYSSEHDALVIGTSNKTEILLGYGTIFGDLASAINPVGDLYKTQIRELARFYKIPDEIIDKPPSADLWAGQTDEKEIGYSYEEIDKLLYYMIDLGYSNERLADINFPLQMIKDIQSRIQTFQFKRRPPVIAKLSNRTINQDFSYSSDWGV